MSSDDLANRYHKEFQFIDAKDKSARKKSRTHVTKEYYRERRWKLVHTLDDEKSPSPEVKELSRPEFVVTVTKLETLRQARNHEPVLTTLTRRKSSTKSGNSGLQLPFTDVPDSPWPSPVTVLGAGRVDPFSSYPIASTWEIHQLVDHYHFVIPSLLHRHWGRNISHPMPIIDLFEVYRQDPVPFLGMLHHASHHLAKLQHNESGSNTQILDYKYRTIRLLNARMATTAGPYPDSIIVGAGLLANAERIWGDKEIARLHWNAVKRMIADRGGFPAFRNNHLVHTKLIWSFIALSGASPAGNPAYIDTFADSVADENLPPGEAPESSFHRACNEFLTFFSERKAAALAALPTGPADTAREVRFPLRSTAFRPGSRMYRALAPVAPEYACPDRRRAVDHCRMACLLYLNLTLSEYGGFSEDTEEFLRRFAGFIEDDDLDCTLSAEHLLWALVRGIEEVRRDERVWRMSRMVGVLKRCGERTWAEVEEGLRLFLVMGKDAGETLQRLKHWDTEAVRRGILAWRDWDGGGEGDGAEPPSDVAACGGGEGNGD
jgi:hypothetical protein